MRMFALLVTVLATVGAGRADDWPAPQVREVFSTSRDYFVRVTPGSSWGDTMGFSSAPKGPYATATFYHREPDGSYRPAAQTTLLTPVAPVEFFVANDGRLVTLDNWHNTGYRTVVAIYAADGTLMKGYALADIFDKQEIEAFPQSVSSIHWHSGPSYINADQKTFYLMIKGGDDLVVGLETGRAVYCRTRASLYKCRDGIANRWVNFADIAPKR
jgi:hypothetical protein